MASQGSCQSFLGCVKGPLPSGAVGLAIYLALPGDQHPRGVIEFDTKAWHHEWWTARACYSWHHTETLVDGTKIWGCGLNTQSGPTKVRWRTAGNEEWLGPKVGEWQYPSDITWADYNTPIYAEVRSTPKMYRYIAEINGEDWLTLTGKESGGTYRFGGTPGVHDWQRAYRVRVDFWTCPNTAVTFGNCSRHSSRWAEFGAKDRDGHITGRWPRSVLTQRAIVRIHMNHIPDPGAGKWTGCTVTPHGPTGRRLHDPAVQMANDPWGASNDMTNMPGMGDVTDDQYGAGISKRAIAFRRHFMCNGTHPRWSHP